MKLKQNSFQNSRETVLFQFQFNCAGSFRDGHYTQTIVGAVYNTGLASPDSVKFNMITRYKLS